MYEKKRRDKVPPKRRWGNQFQRRGGTCSSFTKYRGSEFGAQNETAAAAAYMALGKPQPKYVHAAKRAAVLAGKRRKENKAAKVEVRPVAVRGDLVPGAAAADEARVAVACSRQAVLWVTVFLHSIEVVVVRVAKAGEERKEEWRNGEAGTPVDV